MNNILFVCSVNKQRSKTAEDYFSMHHPDLNFQSAGTNLKICQKEGTNPITEELLAWADIIMVMENSHSKLIRQFSPDRLATKIVILAIEGKYSYFQQELIGLLEAKAPKYFIN